MDSIAVKGPETLFYIGPIAITQTIISLIVVTVTLAVAGVLLGRNLQKRPGKLQVLTEKGVGMLINLIEFRFGRWKKKMEENAAIHREKKAAA